MFVVYTKTVRLHSLSANDEKNTDQTVTYYSKLGFNDRSEYELWRYFHNLGNTKLGYTATVEGESE